MACNSSSMTRFVWLCDEGMVCCVWVRGCGWVWVGTSGSWAVKESSLTQWCLNVRVQTYCQHTCVNRQVEAHRDLEVRYVEECRSRMEKEDVIGHLRDAMGDMQSTLDNLSNEVAVLRRQLERKTAEAATLTDKLRDSEATVNRLNVDLDNMTRENQAVHLELAELQDQQQDHETQIRELTEKVRHLVTMDGVHGVV